MVSAVQQNQAGVELEASGNITLETIRSVAETGVDYISIGALTKNLQAVDLSMRIDLQAL
jgi:nicotinate-nucleotide pyrophosphorylase (carboxylating)